MVLSCTLKGSREVEEKSKGSGQKSPGRPLGRGPPEEVLGKGQKCDGPDDAGPPFAGRRAWSLPRDTGEVWEGFEPGGT